MPDIQSVGKQLRQLEAWLWRVAAVVMAVGIIFLVWRLRERWLAYICLLPLAAGLLAYAFRFRWLRDWSERAYCWLAKWERELVEEARWPFFYKALFWPLDQLWKRSEAWRSNGQRLGARIAGITFYGGLGVSLLVVVVSPALVVLFIVVVVVGLLFALLVAWIGFDFLSQWMGGEKAGSMSSKDKSEQRGRDERETIWERLKAGNYRIDSEGRIYEGSSSTGLVVNQDTGEIERPGLLGSTSTGYRIDTDTGQIQKRDWFSWSATDFRINPESGNIERRGCPTGVRLDRESGRIKTNDCVLSSACLWSRGLSDDCRELEELRLFRDKYLRHRPEGKALLRGYYQLAPDLVYRIEGSGEAIRIYERVYNFLIVPCLDLIRQGRCAEAVEVYRREFLALCAEMGLNGRKSEVGRDGVAESGRWGDRERVATGRRA